jgi:hypothetical protein
METLISGKIIHLPSGPQAILQPPITRTHPMNHGNQKNKTESWNRLELAPTGAPAARRRHPGSVPIRDNRPEVRTDLPMMEHPATQGPKAFFHPDPPHEPYQPTNLKKTKQSHGRISNCARSARACLPLGSVAGARDRVTLIFARQPGLIATTPNARDDPTPCGHIADRNQTRLSGHEVNNVPFVSTYAGNSSRF